MNSTHKTLYAQWLSNNQAQQQRAFELERERKLQEERDADRKREQERELRAASRQIFQDLEDAKERKFNRQMQLAQLEGQNAALMGEDAPEYEDSTMSRYGAVGYDSVQAKRLQEDAILQREIDREHRARAAQLADEQRAYDAFVNEGVQLGKGQPPRYVGTLEEQAVLRQLQQEELKAKIAAEKSRAEMNARRYREGGKAGKSKTQLAEEKLVQQNRERQIKELKTYIERIGAAIDDAIRSENSDRVAALQAEERFYLDEYKKLTGLTEYGAAQKSNVSGGGSREDAVRKQMREQWGLGGMETYKP